MMKSKPYLTHKKKYQMKFTGSWMKLFRIKSQF